MARKTLNFITGNQNKLAEVRAILGDAVELQSKSLDLDEIQGTIEEISLDKCRRAAIAVLHLLSIFMYEAENMSGAWAGPGRRHRSMF